MCNDCVNHLESKRPKDHPSWLLLSLVVQFDGQNRNQPDLKKNYDKYRSHIKELLHVINVNSSSEYKHIPEISVFND
jgi:hypothetical protein